MLLKEAIQNVFLSSAKPEVTAEVLQRFYEQVYQRNLAKSANLFNTDEEASFTGDFSFDVDGTEMCVNFTDLKEAIKTATINDQDIFEISDKYNNIQLQVSATEIAQQLADSNDINYLNMKFAQCMDNADRFLTEAAAYLPSLSANTRMVYDNMANAITQSDIVSKIAYLNQSSGLEQTLNGSLNYNTQTMQSSYTGIKPGQAFIDSIDVSWVDEVPVLGWLNKADKAVKKLQKEARGWLISKAKQLFNFAKTEYKELVENPNDVAILNGDKVEMINIPAKFSLYVELLSNGDSLSGLNTWNALFGDSEIGIISIGPNFYVLKPKFSGEGSIVNVERYLKPIDPYKLYQLMMSIPDLSLKGYENMSINDFITLLTYMNSTDLSFDKSAAENDIYYGLLFSQVIDTMFHGIGAIYFQQFLNASDRYAFFNTEIDAQSPGSLATLLNSSDYVNDVFESIENYVKGTNGSMFILPYGEAYYSFDKQRTVTNADWIRVLTTIAIPDSSSINGFKTINIIDDASSFSSDGVYNYGTISNWYTSPAPAAYYCLGQFPLLAFTGMALHDNLRETLGSNLLWAEQCVPMNAVSNNLLLLSLNTTIKTDQDNVDAINKILVNTIITVAVVVAVVLALKSASALRKTVLKSGLNMNALSTQYQKELLAGNPTEDTFNKLLVAKRKYKLLSTVAGSMSSNAQDILLNSLDTAGVSFNPKVDLDPIVSIIK